MSFNRVYLLSPGDYGLRGSGSTALNVRNVSVCDVGKYVRAATAGNPGLVSPEIVRVIT